MQEQYEAVVQSVATGYHGPYAIVSVITGEFGGSVTFGLHPPIWNESRFPSGGEYVVISELTEKRSGWRANRACFSKNNSRSFAQTPIRYPARGSGGVRQTTSSVSTVQFIDNSDLREIR